ncbi:hypothetical protein [Bacillus massilinigeriensis]|uniref:hypothetical protein n=1 Tax=Bacillus massilionigeriensis TaxID=1805475 RepID=UPI00096B2684|nr:hypothetical protein [Bacillus massilionigeriensis]
MFDPTAFENMKVVLEGALYDRDLEGEICIIGRNDSINLSSLSRSFELTFTLKEKDTAQCTVRVYANLENLASELLPSMKSERLSGCTLSIIFTVDHEDDFELHEGIAKALTEVWGMDRTYQHKMILNPFQEDNMIKKEVTIDFNRLIYEDQMDDFIHMIDFMILSMVKINKIIPV